MTLVELLCFWVIFFFAGCLVGILGIDCARFLGYWAWLPAVMLGIAIVCWWAVIVVGGVREMQRSSNIRLIGKIASLINCLCLPAFAFLGPAGIGVGLARAARWWAAIPAALLCLLFLMTRLKMTRKTG